LYTKNYDRLLLFTGGLYLIACTSVILFRKYSLLVHHSSLEYFGLVSLKSIENGNVAVVSNPQLCYVMNIPWQEILHSANQTRIVRRNMASDACGGYWSHS